MSNQDNTKAEVIAAVLKQGEKGLAKASKELRKDKDVINIVKLKKQIEVIREKAASLRLRYAQKTHSDVDRQAAEDTLHLHEVLKKNLGDLQSKTITISEFKNNCVKAIDDTRSKLENRYRISLFTPRSEKNINFLAKILDKIPADLPGFSQPSRPSEKST